MLGALTKKMAKLQTNANLQEAILHCINYGMAACHIKKKNRELYF
jgi:hypothetical protein